MAAELKALELYRNPTSELEQLLCKGTAPTFDELVGWEFDGTNVGLVPGLLGIRKFRKGFYRGKNLVDGGPEPCIHGYNIPIFRAGVDEPHRAKPSDESPKRFGFYRVYPATENKSFARYPNALLLDYGMGANGLDPSRFLRDYLVKVHADSADVLLGKAYLALGFIKPFVGFFLLQRRRQHQFTR
jgi:hypothetical protein